MKLVELIQQEQEGLSKAGILLLRHATKEVELLESCGGTLQEYTAIQPIGGRFDFRLPGKPETEVIVAIVRDRVHAVYRITGVIATGPSTDICSPEYKAFELHRKNSKGQPKKIRQCRRYSLVPVQSGAEGAEVRGWSGKEIMPVQRSDGGFFDAVEVSAAPVPRTAWGTSSGDAEWVEGTPKLRLHLAKERAPGLADAKKREFIKQHGRLFCQRCELDPVQKYATKAAESCIEVHHAATAVSAMKPGHVTTLGDLECLCANCHRLEHARLRLVAE